MSVNIMYRNGFVSRSFFSVRKILLIIVPLLATMVVFWKFILVADVPFRLDYAEGFVLTNTISILHHIPIYHSVESAPYIFGFYTPLYNYIGAFFLKLFGPDISVLRFMSFIFYLSTGVVVGYIVNKIIKNLFAAVLAGLLFYSAFIVSQWSSIARPDMLGIFLISLGIAVVISRFQKNSTKIVLAAFIFSLAFFSKQNFVFAPLAFFLSSLFTNKKEAWGFAGAYAFFTAVGVFILNMFTHGEFIKQIFIYPGLVPYNNLNVAFRIFAITGISATPFILIAIVKIFKIPKNFLSLYFICSLLTFVMLLRDGGIQNYLLEFVLALILLAMTGVPWERLQAMPVKRFYPLLLVLLFFFVLWSYAAFPWETKTYISERQNIFDKEISTIGRKSQILVEDPLIAYATDSTVELDPYTLGQILDSGQISTTKFFSDIKNGKYEYIDDYGAFNRISGLIEIINNNFQSISILTFSKPVKPFDYSLYNRNKFTEIGSLYKYYPGKTTTGN